MSETLIKVEGVSKKFCRSLRKSLWYGVQDLGREITGRRHGGNGELRPDEFWAVKDVSFELKRGECLGLIGRNGAGKTTLLRLLNGLIKPDTGRIEMRGRLGALIALGAGFNPILTGRENIYVNGSVLGLGKHEIDAKIDEIIDFAEIGEFIDMPVQSYSSGMAVRLGFAVATTLNPDVLIIDEVLAVGDVGFCIKCTRRINSLLLNAAVILVSHDVSVISRVCNRSILIERGHPVFSGTVDRALSLYSSLTLPASVDSINDYYREISTYITIESVTIDPYVLNPGGTIGIVIKINSKKTIRIGRVNINITDIAECIHAQMSTTYDREVIQVGLQKINVDVGPLYLSNNLFFINIVIYEGNNKDILLYLRREMKFKYEGQIKYSACYYPPVQIEINPIGLTT